MHPFTCCRRMGVAGTKHASLVVPKCETYELVELVVFAIACGQLLVQDRLSEPRSRSDALKALALMGPEGTSMHCACHLCSCSGCRQQAL